MSSKAAVRAAEEAAQVKRRFLRWRRDPIAFFAEAIVNPETAWNAKTARPFELYREEEIFLRTALTPRADGSLKYTEILFGAPKKSGKTEIAALCTIYVTIVLGGPYAEAYNCANDLEQAGERVFKAIRRIVEKSPFLARSAKILHNKIEFPSTHATIQPLAVDAASAAGGQQVITTFDELWGVTSELGRRMWDEMGVVPTKKVSTRLTTTYAGFEGESDLLEGLYHRGLEGIINGEKITEPKEIAPDLYEQPGMLMYWTHRLCAPWQTEEWRAGWQRDHRPSQYRRVIENHFVGSSSPFIPMEKWHECIDPALTKITEPAFIPVWIGVDTSIRHDQTAIVAVTLDEFSVAPVPKPAAANAAPPIPGVLWRQSFNPAAAIAPAQAPPTPLRRPHIRLVWHEIVKPTPNEPIDYEAAVYQRLLQLSRWFRVIRIAYDPFQMVSTAQRLLMQHRLPMREMPQSPDQLTRVATNLIELVESAYLRMYQDAELTEAARVTVAIESPRGLRLGKTKRSQMVDPIIALGFACLAASEDADRPLPAYERGSVPMAEIRAGMWMGR